MSLSTKCKCPLCGGRAVKSPLAYGGVFDTHFDCKTCGINIFTEIAMLQFQSYSKNFRQNYVDHLDRPSRKDKPCSFIMEGEEIRQWEGNLYTHLPSENKVMTDPTSRNIIRQIQGNKYGFHASMIIHRLELLLVHHVYQIEILHELEEDIFQARILCRHEFKIPKTTQKNFVFLPIKNQPDGGNTSADECINKALAYLDEIVTEIDRPKNFYEKQNIEY